MRRLWHPVSQVKDAPQRNDLVPRVAVHFGGQQPQRARALMGPEMVGTQVLQGFYHVARGLQREITALQSQGGSQV